VPAALLVPSVKVCAIVLPDPAFAPVTPPVIVPIVHVNVLFELAVNAILVAVLLHITVVFAAVTTGLGFTVTVIVYTAPVQAGEPVDVGVTRYSTVPAVALPGLVNVCAMLLPDDAVAPVIDPVTVPMVQLKVLATEAVNEILVAAPEHIDAVLAVVTDGIGFTVTVTTDELAFAHAPLFTTARK
jgi:hypothetical protein